MPVCVETPRKVTIAWSALKLSLSSSPRGRAVEGVGRGTAEAVEVEVIGPCADLLVGVEADPDPPVRELRVLLQVRDGRDDLGDPGLVVGAEERRPVGGDELVADVVGERRALLGVERDLRVAGQRQAAALVGDDLRLHVLARHVRERVHVREEADRRHLVLDRRGQRRRHVAVLVEVDVLEPELAQLLLRAVAGGPTAAGCEGKTSWCSRLEVWTRA